jgi:O-antigen ligase
VNPITYGHAAVTTMIAAISLYRPKLKITKLLILAAGVASASFLLFLSGSRGPIIALVSCLMVLVVFQRHYRRLLLLLIPVFALVIFNIDSLEIANRFMSIGSDSSSLERLGAQLRAIEQFINNPFFGSAYVELQSGTYPHNLIVEAAMSTGIIGLLLFVVLSFLSSWRVFVMLRSGYVLLPLLVLQYQLAAFFSGSLFLSNSLWMSFAFAFAASARPSFEQTLVPINQNAASSFRINGSGR